ncbi:gp1 [Lacticaseibacillus paracasei subsp. paracasei Lpp48]|jgi:phage terminase small subunit|nr:gp1 [Lacticaseibacillus paracasei subsp. paracasei Lpp48]DAL86108.1 MAG TPA: terminase small subunit [Caudoviricetes sp.]
MDKLDKLKNRLLSQIDKTNPIETEKVDRYVSMVDMFYKLQKEAIKQPIIEIENGSQHFTKSNPALADMNKINASLISLGKDMGLSAPPAGIDGKGTGYDPDDLL